jgi:hypothetical protein
MKKLTTPFILGFLLALVFLSQLHAQTEGGTSADTRPSTASPTTPGQAPDEVMKKLSELVHAEKYAEAQQLTAGLVLAYPDDQRLIKAKALLDKSLAAASAKAIPNADPSASDSVPTPATGTSATQLTGMDKVDYNALIVLARQAQQNTDLEQQRAALKQFMDQSTSFLRRHPDQMLLWKLRVASAISLNDPIAGYEAGQKLLAAGAADSNDPSLQQLLAELRNKGWLDKRGAEDAQEYIRLRSLTLRLVYGDWSKSGLSVHYKAILTLTVSGLGDTKEPVGIRLENGSPKTCRVDGGPTGTFAIKPGDAAGRIYTTTRTATLSASGWSAQSVPCTVTASVVDKTGKDISVISISNGF